MTMKHNQEIKKLLEQILAEAKEIEAQMNTYKQSANFSEVIETLSSIYQELTLVNRQILFLPSGTAQYGDIDEAYLQSFHGTE